MRRSDGGAWSWVGPTRLTDARGFFQVSVRARAGTIVQVVSPRDRSSSLPLRLT